jgi:hypothetical protein
MTFFSKNRLSRSVAAIAMLGSLFSAVEAHAATQGTIGTTSSGQINITATIAGLVQITNLSDLNFTPVLNGSSAAQLTENVCVWSNTLTKGYTIKATGNGTSSAFTLASGSNAPVPYSVSWAGTSGATSGTALTTNVASSTFTSTALAPACLAGSNTATLFVSIASTDQDTMVANAAYTGILTLLVTPV